MLEFGPWVIVPMLAVTVELMTQADAIMHPKPSRKARFPVAVGLSQPEYEAAIKQLHNEETTNHMPRRQPK